MTYWETQITQVIYFWKDLFEMPAGSSVMGWKEFYTNRRMYHLLANRKTISLMAYLWITQSCWEDSSSIPQWPFSFLSIELIEMTLVHKTIQVASVYLKNKPSAHCIVHPPPRQSLLLSPNSTLLAYFFWFLILQWVLKGSLLGPNVAIGKTCWAKGVCLQGGAGREETLGMQWLGEMPSWRGLTHLLRRYVVLGKARGPLHPSLIIIPGEVSIAPSIACMGKPRLREIISLQQGHRTNKYWSWDSFSGFVPAPAEIPLLYSFPSDVTQKHPETGC